MDWKKLDKFFEYFTRGITFFSFFILSFIIIFIVKESLPLFKEIGVIDFIFGKRWYPSSYSNPAMGIFNIILATIYISVLSIVIAFPIGLGCSIFLSCILEEKTKNILKPYIDILAGIPSVIYGFLGLIIVSWHTSIIKGKTIMLKTIPPDKTLSPDGRPNISKNLTTIISPKNP